MTRQIIGSNGRSSSIKPPVGQPRLRDGAAPPVAAPPADRATGASGQPDFVQGTWLGETIAPQAGLLTAYQGDLIGRRIDNGAGPTPLTVAATLVDPTSAEPRYVALVGPSLQGVVIVPVNALAIAPASARIAVNGYTLHTLPNFPALAALEVQYPRTVIAAPVAEAPPPAADALPPVTPAPDAAAVSPLPVARPGGVVHLLH